MTENPEVKPENPWTSIWFKPRATIGQIVAENPNRSLWLLCAIYGFCSLLNIFQSTQLGSVMGVWPILGLALLASPLWGYASFSLWSLVVMAVGKLFKGQGSFLAIRSAYAWSCVPFTINVFFWVLLVFLFGNRLFLNFPEAYPIGQPQLTVLFIVLIAKVVLSIWSLVIYVNGLAEVQKFSVFRAILNVVVAGLVIGLVLSALWLLASSLIGPTSETQVSLNLFNKVGV